ncbi:MAG TPA: hypothetical protein VLA16_01910 [Ideonella sp.]|nr:hypothetical protein [Ideonella sp.]
MIPLHVDRQARAPLLEGYGQASLSVTTGSAEARRWFAQGMEQAYAFNEFEAVRSFKAALAQDPACAMCAWGVAYQLGPNINHTDRGDLTEVLRHVDHALRHAEKLTPRDRDLIEALALRYGHASEARNTAVITAPVCGAGGGSGNSGSSGDRADPLDLAYAERMRGLADRYPDDPDVVSMYAEAEMIATRGGYWWHPATGQPAGRIGEVAHRLEAALEKHPDHVGLNHYMIHAVDALPVAARAEPSADRLGRLAPNSPHLLHMPAHTYVQLGRYADASRVNVQALAADDALEAELGRQNFPVSKDWRGHDGEFLWYAALMEGRGELALQTARNSALRAEQMDYEYGEFVRSRPLLTLLRLERWDDVLAEPAARGDKGVAALLGEYAHGVALARTGQPARAAEMLTRLDPRAAKLAAAYAGDHYFDKMMRGIALVTRQRLRAELALSQGRNDEALAHQAQALAASKDLDETEPPVLAAGSRLTLGDMQLKARQWPQAEQTFRADLALHPRSGWALRGISRALRGQGKVAEAEALQAALNRDWAAADARLLALN